MAAILITVAGHETTTNLLGAGLVTLLTPNEDGARIATADQLVEGVKSVAVKAFLVCRRR
jgi:cytochrome P450